MVQYKAYICLHIFPSPVLFSEPNCVFSNLFRYIIMTWRAMRAGSAEEKRDRVVKVVIVGLDGLPGSGMSFARLDIAIHYLR